MLDGETEKVKEKSENVNPENQRVTGSMSITPQKRDRQQEGLFLCVTILTGLLRPFHINLNYEWVFL